MHHIDLGLFKYQLEFTQDILKAVGRAGLQKNFDERLRQIPRFPGLKLISKLGHLNVITASDYRHVMKTALFILDDIFNEWNQITCKELCELYAKFSKMYIMSRAESYTESELKAFEVIIISKKFNRPLKSNKVYRNPNYSTDRKQLLIGALIFEEFFFIK